MNVYNNLPHIVRKQEQVQVGVRNDLLLAKESNYKLRTESLCLQRCITYFPTNPRTYPTYTRC